MKNNIKLIIRQEELDDYKAVFDLISKAFFDIEYSDQKEQYLVNRLRKSKGFIPELSLVAEKEGNIVGYILLTEVFILDSSKKHKSLALAPVAVKPEFQKMGIGSELITQAHKIAIHLGYDSVVIIGHKEYYPRFGYKLANIFGIKFPFDVPEENCFVKELIEDGLKNVKGLVKYPVEFNEV